MKKGSSFRNPQKPAYTGPHSQGVSKNTLTQGAGVGRKRGGKGKREKVQGERERERILFVALKRKSKVFFI